MKRLALWFFIVSGVLFAVQCGEYSTLDILRQRSREAGLRVAIESLTNDIDSLERLRQLLRRDAATQERVAREEFGMVRGNRELLYRFVDPDSLRRRGR